MSQIVFGRDTRNVLHTIALELWPGYSGLSKKAIVGDMGDETKCYEMIGAIRTFLDLELAVLRNQHEEAKEEGAKAIKALGLKPWQAFQKADKIDKEGRRLAKVKSDFEEKLAQALEADRKFAESKAQQPAEVSQAG